jgi:hypothetical protein
MYYHGVWTVIHTKLTIKLNNLETIYDPSNIDLGIYYTFIDQYSIFKKKMICSSTYYKNNDIHLKIISFYIHLTL